MPASQQFLIFANLMSKRQLYLLLFTEVHFFLLLFFYFVGVLELTSGFTTPPPFYIFQIEYCIFA
jgi:hypothetical protein